jgi:O-acetyl-ADP-ribose deacetylase (regulator of RNase III)
MGYRDADRRVPKRAGSASSEAIIREATTKSISIADNSGCESIAFPALATGVGGFPADECARVMINAARDYARQHPETRIKRVIFILFTAGDLQVFERALKTIERI